MITSQKAAIANAKFKYDEVLQNLWQVIQTQYPIGSHVQFKCGNMVRDKEAIVYGNEGWNGDFRLCLLVGKKYRHVHIDYITSVIPTPAKESTQ